jgi:hypothetical protein
VTIADFKDYLANTHMTFSYKAVMVLALLDTVDQHGKTSLAILVHAFHGFYLNRQRLGLPTEKERSRHPSPLCKADEVSDAQIRQILARHPLPLLSDFIAADDDYVWIKPVLWSQMTASDLVELKEIALQRIKAYYEGVE